MYDMIVIGGGPAALSAAFYAQGKGVNVAMLFEELGGKVGWLQSLVGPQQEPYLPGNELVPALAKQISSKPERVINDRALKVTKRGGFFAIETAAHGTVEATVVVVATGATPRTLEVSGAARLLERGLDYSPTTFAHLVAGKRVGVIGGTMRALSGAAELARNAQLVYLIVPTTTILETALGDALRARPNVQILEDYEVTAVLGDDTVKEMIVAKGAETRSLRVDRAFVCLGLDPCSAPVRDVVDLDPKGFIVVDEYNESSMPGIFAAGDVTTMFGEQVLIAIGDGARAGMNAYHHLLGRWLATSAPDVEHVAGV